MMYNIKDSSGNVINTIMADASFVEANFSHYEAVVIELQPHQVEEAAKDWRDAELKETDWIVSLNDHPERSDYMTYRTALRNWPSTSDFPATKPTNAASPAIINSAVGED